ncbi:MAG: DUF2059 domain-containing protein [Kordiimonadaceae bacterium]|nr:DUF2059 domain-containing protein [Kordiimonadaceae bacterium]MBO6570211.1 DUF2059 domain-containing protein [Kordiimonadaceae bacterium]MBO6965691.1 DUF2059 domain-containing protein [Kordiimonadaceae bacterium]
MQKFLFVLTLMFCTQQIALADEFEEKASQLLHLSNSVEPTLKAMDRMIETMDPVLSENMFRQYSAAGKDVTKEDVDQLLLEWRQEFVKRIEARLVPLIVDVYREHLTIADLDFLISVMEKPEYKKYTDMVPALMEKSQIVGEQMGQEIGLEVLNELVAKNPKFQ